MEIKDIFGDYRSGFIDNSSFNTNVKIHFIEKNYTPKSNLSLILSPGLWEPAERAFPLFDGLDCHCVSLSYRGRGQSETPLSGYDLEHHVSDLQTVIDALEIESFVMVAFSRGTGYACGFIEKYPEKVKGMIIVDHPPVHVKPYKGYADYWKNLVYLGYPVTKFMRPDALDSLEREAREVKFWGVLNQLNIPITVLHGISKKSKIPSDLSEEDILNYRKFIKNYCEINFEYSGHMIVDEELGKYRSVVNDFYKTICKKLY